MLTDSQLRNNMVKALELLIADVKSHELPIAPYGGEYFLKTGGFGIRGGQRRYYRALIAVGDSKEEARQTVQYANVQNE